MNVVNVFPSSIPVSKKLIPYSSPYTTPWTSLIKGAPVAIHVTAFYQQMRTLLNMVRYQAYTPGTYDRGFQLPTPSRQMCRRCAPATALRQNGP